MLVITGTQRAGTSVLMKMLLEEGVYVPDVNNWWDDEVDGGMENKVICKFFSQYFCDLTFPYGSMEVPDTLAGLAWYDLLDRFEDMDLEATKFSYLLMNPVFVNVWNKFRGHSKDQFLICYRPPRGVCKSKQRHPDQFDSDSVLLQQTPEALQWNFQASVRQLEWYGYDYYFLGYPAFLHSRQWVNIGLGYLGFDRSISERTWKETVDLDRIHVQ